MLGALHMPNGMRFHSYNPNGVTNADLALADASSSTCQYQLVEKPGSPRRNHLHTKCAPLTLLDRRQE